MSHRSKGTEVGVFLARVMSSRIVTNPVTPPATSKLRVATLILERGAVDELTMLGVCD